MNIFLSYSFSDTDTLLVSEAHYYLSKQPDVTPFLWSYDGKGPAWPEELANRLARADALVVFAGQTCGQTQPKEVTFFCEDNSPRKKKRPVLVAKLAQKIDQGLRLLVNNCLHLELSAVGRTTVPPALGWAKAIIQALGMHWVADDGIPQGYPFQYEKEIIGEYANGKASLKRIREGVPPVWPTLDRHHPWYNSPLAPANVGEFREENKKILVDTRMNNHTPLADACSLLEAGPRERLFHPRQKTSHSLGIGILVSGGIAPGINAVIEGIVKRHTLYKEESERQGFKYSLKMKGYVEGFRALLRPGSNSLDLDAALVEPKAEQGGSFLGTSRPEELLGVGRAREQHLKEIVNRLCSDDISILYIIGGDGSMRAAHSVSCTARALDKPLSVVGVPKTMDNDILWVWQAFGFLSAVDKAREVIGNLHTEVSSNPRLALIQLFGSDSGFVASHAAYSTPCDLVLIPEDPLTLDAMVTHLINRLMKRMQAPETRKTTPYGLVVMAETALPADADKYVNDREVGLSANEKKEIRRFLDNDRRVIGQTPDELRTGGLKMVRTLLEARLKEYHPTPPRGAETMSANWSDLRVVTNEPRHIIRSTRPSPADIIFGERLGTLAVDNAMAGYQDFMVSQWLTEFVLVPLKLVVLGRKRVPTFGIFWKSVRARTGQPPGLGPVSREKVQARHLGALAGRQ